MTNLNTWKVGWVFLGVFTCVFAQEKPSPVQHAGQVVHAKVTPETIEESLKTCLSQDPKEAILNEAGQRALYLTLAGVGLANRLQDLGSNSSYEVNLSRTELMPSPTGKAVDAFIGWKNAYMNSFRPSHNDDQAIMLSTLGTAVVPAAALGGLTGSGTQALLKRSAPRLIGDGSTAVLTGFGVVGLTISYLSSGGVIDVSLTSNTRQLSLQSKKEIIDGLERAIRPTISELGNFIKLPEDKQNKWVQLVTKEIIKNKKVTSTVGWKDNDNNRKLYDKPQSSVTFDKSAFKVDVIEVAKKNGVFTAEELASMKAIEQVMHSIENLKDPEKTTEASVVKELSPKETGEQAIKQLVFMRNILNEMLPEVRSNYAMERAVSSLKNDVDKSLQTIQTMCELAKY